MKITVSLRPKENHRKYSFLFTYNGVVSRRFINVFDNEDVVDALFMFLEKNNFEQGTYTFLDIECKDFVNDELVAQYPYGGVIFEYVPNGKTVLHQQTTLPKFLIQ